MQKKSLVALSVILSACATIPNARLCSVAGDLSAGMNCAYALDPKTDTMTLDETIDFLEPAEATPSEPERAGAICMSAIDYEKTKTAIEKACHLLKGRCQKEKVTDTLKRIDELQNASKRIP